MIGQHQQALVREGTPDLAEEAQGEGRDAAALVEGVAIELVEGRPLLRADLPSREQPETDAGLGDPAALPPDLLALGRREGGEEVLEILIPVVFPVKLAADAAHEPLSFQVPRLCVRREEPVQRGDPELPGDLQGAVDQRGGLLVFGGSFGDQDARTGRRGVGGGDDQLRVVGQATARVGVRPAPVEDELAIGIGLEVTGGGSDQRALDIVQGQVTRQPAEALADAAMAFHGGKEFVTQEWGIRIGETVPLGARDRLDGVVGTKLVHGDGLRSCLLGSDVAERPGCKGLPRKYPV